MSFVAVAGPEVDAIVEVHGAECAGGAHSRGIDREAGFEFLAEGEHGGIHFSIAQRRQVCQ